MRVGIRFGDNDFTSYTRAFMEMFVVPTFVQREPGHFVTHLTSAQLVELFNTHLPYVHRFMSWYYNTNHRYYYPGAEQNKANLHELMLHKDWLRINEMDIYWNDQIDKLLADRGTDSDFVWTDGVRVFIA